MYYFISEMVTDVLNTSYTLETKAYVYTQFLAILRISSKKSRESVIQ